MKPLQKKFVLQIISTEISAPPNLVYWPMVGHKLLWGYLKMNAKTENKYLETFIAMWQLKLIFKSLLFVFLISFIYILILLYFVKILVPNRLGIFKSTNSLQRLMLSESNSDYNSQIVPAFKLLFRSTVYSQRLFHWLQE